MKKILFYIVALALFAPATLDAQCGANDTVTDAAAGVGGLIASGGSTNSGCFVPAAPLELSLVVPDVLIQEGNPACPADAPEMCQPPQIGINGDLVITIDGLWGSWGGDLNIEVTLPDGTVAEVQDNGGSTTDPGGDAAPGATYTWSTAGAVTISDWATDFGPNAFTTPVAPGVDPNGTYSLMICDDVGGDDHTFDGWSVSFVPVAAAPALDCPAVCDFSAPEIEIALEAGECEEVAFFTYTTDCDICPPAPPLPAGVLGGAPIQPLVETFGADGGLTGFSLDESSDGNPVTYTITVPADGNLGFAVLSQGSTAFWDPFTVDLNGTTLATGSTTQCVPVVAGDVLTFTIGSVDGVQDSGAYDVVVTNLAFSPSTLPCYNVVQTAGPLSGDYLAPGTYGVTYEVTLLNPDPLNPCGNIPEAPELFDGTITVLPYTGPVTESLACNDHVNISLDETCSALLGADNFLEGGPYSCYTDYTVAIQPFNAGDFIVVDQTTPMVLPCGDHTYMVTSPAGNTCWGTFTVEDKIAPEFAVADFGVTCVEYPNDVPVILVPEFDASFIEILDSPVVIDPATGTGGAVIDFTVPCDDCTINDVNIYVNASHTWVGDLDIILVSPDGAQTDLISFGGCFNQEWMIDATFDDECAFNNLTMCADLDMGGDCVWSTGGLFGNLAAYDGGQACGDWQLIIEDNVGGDGGVINQVALILNDGDGSCDVSAVFPTPNPVGCECQSYAFEDSYSPDDCGVGVLTRTWFCTDKAGNQSEGQVQTITVEGLSLDGLGDSWFVPPALIELPCGTGTDPWDIVAFFDDPKTNDCPDSDADCPMGIYEFNEGIAFGFPHYEAWGCNSGCNAKIEPHMQPIDNNVCNLFVTYTDQELPACGAACSGNVKVIRTWTVLDWCTSETIPYVQLIKSVDIDAPEISAPDIQLSVNPWGCVASGTLPGPEHLFDACSGPDLSYTVSGPAGVSIITLTDASGNFLGYGVSGAPKGEHTFTYTAVDCCGNIGTGSFTVTVVDDTPPTAIAKEATVISLTSGGSDDGGFAKLYTTSIDNGSHDGDCGPVKLEIRRPGGAPNCGNIGIDGQNNNVTFNNNGDPDDNNKDTDAGAFVKFCCDDLADGNTYEGLNGPVLYNDSMLVVLRVWDDGNCDGVAGGPEVDGVPDNYNETWAYVQVENKLPPVIICPPDATITCDSDYLLHDDQTAPTDAEYAVLAGPEGTGVAYASGVCSSVEVTYEDRYNEDICFERNNEITRKWCVAGTNICCDQKIDIVKVGAFDPNTISWNNGFPEELVELECMEDELQEPTWQEAPCDLIGWSMQSDTFEIEGDACLKVINNYTVIDWCDDGAEYTFTQTVKIIDDEDPTVETEGPCIEVDGTALAAGGTCSAEGVTLCATGTDPGDCESPWLKWQVLIDLNSNWTYDYVYSSYVSPIDPNFNTPLNELYIAPSAPGDQVCITLPEPVAGSKYNHRAVWKLSDGCQNNSSLTVEFQVTDKKAPTPYCYSVSTATMGENGADGVEIWACDFVLDVFDNCTPADLARYTFNGPDEGYDTPESTPGWNDDTQCEGITFSCPDEGNVVSVKVYTWDECNNWDVCYVELTLSGCDSGGEGTGEEGSNRIAGDVSTEYGDMVEGVDVTITSNQPEYPMTMATDVNGSFSSENHYDNHDYAVSAYKNDDPRNGVSTLDIILIQRHILNLAQLSSPYQYIAADATNDQKITAADIVDIRKLILEVYDEYPSNTSWRFADANQALTTANAFAFNEVLDIIGLSSDMLEENFRAIKIGDVNGNAVTNLNGSDSEARSGKSLNLTLNGVSTAQGVNVEVTSENFNAITGYQFTMNTAGMTFAGVTAGAIDMNDKNIAVIDNNTLTMSWDNLEGVTVGNEVLFTLQFTGSDNTANIAITSEVTNAESYDADLNIMNVVLGGAEAEFALEQNEPNPFSVQTAIQFSLPEAGDATLRVMDVTGKVVKQITGTYAAGSNTVVLTKAELGTSGVLYYQLESGDFSATKKMIIVE